MSPRGGYQRVQYRFGGPPGWNSIPGVTKILLVAIAAVYLATLAFRPIAGLLLLDPGLVVRHFQVWRLVTYPVVHTSIISVLLYGYMLWAFGTQQERIDGSQKYARFLLLSALSAGGLGSLAAVTLGGSIYAGAGGLITNLLILWGFREPEQEVLAFFVVPLKVKWLVAIVVVIVVFSEIEQGFSLAGVLYVLGGAPVAWYWSRGRGRLPGLGLRERYYRWKLNRLRKKQGLRAVRDDEGSPPGGWVN